MAKREASVRFAAVVEYDGTGLGGWQLQPNALTVQQFVESSLEGLYGQPVRVHASGRTDAGVHARGQVIHFDARDDYDARIVLNAANARLDSRVAIVKAIKVDRDFHARYHALRKEYEYRILCSYAPSPLRSSFTWHRPKALNVEALRDAAQMLEGEHDFRSFATEPDNIKDSVRTMHYVRVLEESDEIRILFCANGFLYNLVRSLTGALVMYSTGGIERSKLLSCLSNTNSRQPAPLAPANGLTLNWVEYDKYPQLKREV
ncbi:MAG: tRNA pseudouridine(38-40) synthase TruA [Planctomycetota bacterium]|nr:tRNA pseudouridine(38-40) synthase TruA [Planctomycetota bacterium]